MDIESIKKQFAEDVAAGKNFEELKVKYLGRKSGLLNDELKALGGAAANEKQVLGPQLNQLRAQIEAKLSDLQNSTLNQLVEVDFTVPPLTTHHGHLHPLSKTQAELQQIFTALGFTIELGPEIETDWYNFTDSISLPTIRRGICTTLFI